MTLEALMAFLLVIAVAGYFQTVAGFGLGMIVIGAIAGLGITSVATIAAVVNLLALVNCAIALPGRLDNIDRRMVVAVALGVVPAIGLGLMLLTYLSTSAASVLRIALGVLVVYGGLSVVRRAREKQRTSSSATFLFTGLFAGLCGGLFGISGPPLIYQLYRQPIPLTAIRNMLILFFALTSSVRIALLGVSGQIDSRILLLTLIAGPMIGLTTYLGRRFPPPLSADAMRAIVCAVLVGIGCELIGAELLA